MILAEKNDESISCFCIVLWSGRHSCLKFIARQINTKAFYLPTTKQYEKNYPLSNIQCSTSPTLNYDVPPRFLSVSPNCERAGCRSRSMPAEDRCYNWWIGGTLRYYVLYMQTRATKSIQIPQPLSSMYNFWTSLRMIVIHCRQSTHLDIMYILPVRGTNRVVLTSNRQTHWDIGKWW